MSRPNIVIRFALRFFLSAIDGVTPRSVTSPEHKPLFDDVQLVNILIKGPTEEDSNLSLPN